MRMPIMALACFFLAVWLGLVRTGDADVVYLKSGSKREGTVVSQDEKEVVLEIARRGLKARIRIPIDEVERVEKVKSPKEEYQERLAAIGAANPPGAGSLRVPPQAELKAPQGGAGDGKAWLDFGLWCEKKGLAEEAGDCYRKAMKINPDLEEAGRKLRLIRVSGQWVKFDEVIVKARDLVAAGKTKEAIPLLESVREAAQHLDSLKRREVWALLCRCYELTGVWAKAQGCYDELVKSYGVLTSEVAVIRVKQRLLKANPDGTIEAGLVEPKPAEAGKPDLAKAIGSGVKAMGDGMKAVADFVARKPAPRVSLSDPKVMDAAIRREAEEIVKSTEDMVRKADMRALSERIVRATNPLEHLQRLVMAIPNLMRLTTPPPRSITIGEADEMYAKAVERALDADLLVRDISRPVRVTIVKKRLVILDDFIAQARAQVETHSLYIPPPPPNAPLDPNAKVRLLQLSPSKEQVTQFRQAIENLEKLYALKSAVLRPMSDDLLAEYQKNEKDMEPLGDARKKADTLAALANDLKEYADLEAKMQTAWAKAQASHPTRFPYNYDSFQSPDGLYYFRDRGKSWRLHSEVCMNYCEEAMSVARKRRAVMAKYPERPQAAGEMNALKNFIVQVYNYKIGVMSQYNKKGGTA